MPVKLTPYTFKTLDETLWEMMAYFFASTGKRPDPEPGGVLRTIFEAVAFEVEELTHRFDHAAKKAIYESVFNSFDFEILGATPAMTLLRFERTPNPAGMTIPEGTRVGRADGLEYATVAEAIIPADAAYVDVAGVCLQAGAIGNATTGTINIPRTSMPGLSKAHNITPATLGKDGESLEETIRRFALYVASLHKATIPALRATALAHIGPGGERVTEALVLDHVSKPALAPGVVEVWLDNGTATVSANMRSSVLGVLEPAAGAVLSVHSVTPKPIHMTYQITGPAEALPSCLEAAKAYLLGLRPGQKVSRENLIAILTNADNRILEVTLNLPEADTAVTQTERAVFGSATATAIAL